MGSDTHQDISKGCQSSPPACTPRVLALVLPPSLASKLPKIMGCMGMPGRACSMDGIWGEPMGAFLSDELYGTGKALLLLPVCLLLLQDLVVLRGRAGQCRPAKGEQLQSSAKQWSLWGQLEEAHAVWNPLADICAQSRAVPTASCLSRPSAPAVSRKHPGP